MLDVITEAPRADDDSAFADPFDVLPGEDGTVYLAEATFSGVRHVDVGSGTLVRSWGREGEGPGEFGVIGGFT